ncbi:hypothetical protein [Lysinibacillus fusiformis]|uniref:hypothetical protein n=1 Tax=Lysinibacillus fusiformis TaxID=28031 RepID=UPI003557B2C3
MNKSMLFIFTIVVLVILGGCTLAAKQNDIVKNGDNSYVPYVIIDSDIYYSYQLDDDKYTKDQVFGEILKKVMSSDRIIKEDLTSNYYNKGTLIYTVNEDNKIFIIEQETGDEILKKIE